MSFFKSHGSICILPKMARKLKMTKKCIAARKRYRAKKAGVPARRKRKKRGGSVIYDLLGGKQLKKRSYKGSFGEWSARGNVSKGGFMQGGREFKSQLKRKSVIAGKKRYPLKRRVKPAGAGLRRKRKRRGRGRGRGRGAKGAGFFEDLGKSFEWVGNAVLTALPFVAAAL